jgi:hypothetical protein
MRRWPTRSAMPSARGKRADGMALYLHTKSRYFNT